MYNINSDKSIESISEDNIFTSQNTHNKSQKYSNLKEETKDLNNISNHNSGDEELIRKKLVISTEIDYPSKQKIQASLITPKNNPGTLTFSISPIKKGSKKNLLVDIMEKSKKINVPRKSVIYPVQELRLKDLNTNNENQRKDGYGVPINKRNKKKIKVTFTDTLNTDNSKIEKNQLAEIIPIESYKKYNYIEGIPREEDLATTKSTCQCCLIN